LKEFPEQVAQSEWHERHEPDEEKVSAGQLATQLPSEASRLPEQVKQNVDDPAQVPQLESQERQLRLSCGDRNVPEGQVSTHFPSEKRSQGGIQCI